MNHDVMLSAKENDRGYTKMTCMPKTTVSNWQQRYTACHCQICVNV